MDLLITKKHYTIFCVVLFFLYSCNTKNSKYSELKKDSLSSNATINNLYNSAWHFGFHHFNFDNDKFCTGYLLNENTVRIINARDTAEFKDIQIEEEALGLYGFDTSLYLVFPNSISKYTINKNFSYQIINYKTNSLFNDSLIIYPYVSSGIVSIYNNKILIPFRVENNSTNMIDSFVYLQLIQKGDSMIIENKLISHPIEYKNEFEYLKLPLCVYSKANNSLYYTFQKIPKLYKLNLQTNKLDSTVLSGYETITFNQKSKQDISYIRKYLQNNDYTTKILIDENSNIYAIKSCKFQGTQQYELIILDSTLNVLCQKKLIDSIIPEISFTHNNKLYVKNTFNNFLIYSLDNNN